MRRGIVVLVALGTGAAAACSGPRAGTLPTPPPTTASRTPTHTATPDLAESLRLAVHTYFDALYAAGMDPANKTNDLAALIHRSCGCWRTIEVLREQAAAGRHVDYTYRLRDLKVLEVREREGTIRYTVRQSAGALRTRSGEVIESYPASTESYSAHFTRTTGPWLVRRLDAYR